jgi:hypothetical protein
VLDVSSEIRLLPSKIIRIFIPDCYLPSFNNWNVRWKVANILPIYIENCLPFGLHNSEVRPTIEYGRGNMRQRNIRNGIGVEHGDIFSARNAVSRIIKPNALRGYVKFLERKLAHQVSFPRGEVRCQRTPLIVARRLFESRGEREVTPQRNAFYPEARLAIH